MPFKRDYKVTIRLSAEEWGELLQAAKIRGYEPPWPREEELLTNSKLRVEAVARKGVKDHTMWLVASKGPRSLGRKSAWR